MIKINIDVSGDSQNTANSKAILTSQDTNTCPVVRKRDKKSTRKEKQTKVEKEDDDVCLKGLSIGVRYSSCTCDELEQSCVQEKRSSDFAALLDSITMTVISETNEKESEEDSWDTDHKESQEKQDSTDDEKFPLLVLRRHKAVCYKNYEKEALLG